MFENIKDWWKSKRALANHFHVIIVDGPEPGTVSFLFQNFKKGLNFKMPPEAKGIPKPYIPMTDGHIYQLVMNGLVAIGEKIRKTHTQCAEKRCEVCKFVDGMKDTAAKLSANRNTIVNARTETPIPLKAEKIIVPPGTK